MSYTQYKIWVEQVFARTLSGLYVRFVSRCLSCIELAKTDIFSDIEDALDLNMPSSRGYHVRTPNAILYQNNIRQINKYDFKKVCCRTQKKLQKKIKSPSGTRTSDLLLSKQTPNHLSYVPLVENKYFDQIVYTDNNLNKIHTFIIT